MPSKNKPPLGWYQKEDGTWVVRLGNLRKWLGNGEPEFKARFGESTKSKHHLSRIILGFPKPRPTKGSLDDYEAMPEAVELILGKSRTLPRALAELEVAKAAVVEHTTLDMAKHDYQVENEAAVPDVLGPSNGEFRLEPTSMYGPEPKPSAIKEGKTRASERKARRTSDRELRKWQKERLEALLEILDKDAKRDSALVYACPASGKTFFALVVAGAIAQMKQRKVPIVILTPRVDIKSGWIDEAASIGITLIPLNDARPFLADQDDMLADGYVLTYSQAIMYLDTLRVFCERVNPILILDEVHHTSTDTDTRDGNVWGRTIENAFASSLFKLSLTGTPWGPGEGEGHIPWAEYDASHNVVPTIRYVYSEAIEDRVCRPLDFTSWGSEFIENDEEGHPVLTDFDTASSEKKRQSRLTAAVTDDKLFLPGLLRAAHAKLLEVRAEPGRENSGGLVVTRGRNEARAVGRLLEGITGTEPTIVYHDPKVANNPQKIQRFREGDSFWIVGINMLSEGVDIPRLSVGVFCTNITTSLYFRQFCGRVIRRRGTDENSVQEYAHVFMPGATELKTHALLIRGEVYHALGDKARTRDEGDYERSGGIRELPIKVRHVAEESIIVCGTVIKKVWLQANEAALKAYKEKWPNRDVPIMELAIFLVGEKMLPPFDDDESEAA